MPGRIDRYPFYYEDLLDVKHILVIYFTCIPAYWNGQPDWQQHTLLFRSDFQGNEAKIDDSLMDKFLKDLISLEVAEKAHKILDR